MHTSPFRSPFVYTLGCHISESKIIFGGRRGYSCFISSSLPVFGGTEKLTSGKMSRALRIAPSYKVSEGLVFEKGSSAGDAVLKEGRESVETKEEKN